MNGLNEIDVTKPTLAVLAQITSHSMKMLLWGSMMYEGGNALPLGNKEHLLKNVAEIRRMIASMGAISRAAGLDVDWPFSEEGSCSEMDSFMFDEVFMDGKELPVVATTKDK